MWTLAYIINCDEAYPSSFLLLISSPLTFLDWLPSGSVEPGPSLASRLPVAVAVPSPGAAALMKIVGKTSALSLLRGLSRPRLDAIAESGSKQSSLKWSLHRTECSLGPFHSALVRCTCLIHCSRIAWSFGKRKRLTPSLYVLEHPAATQHLTMLLHAFSCMIKYSLACSMRSPCDVTRSHAFDIKHSSYSSLRA